MLYYIYNYDTIAFTYKMWKQIKQDLHKRWIWNSVVTVILGYWLYDWGNTVRFPPVLEMFLFSKVPWPALGPTQPPIQWVPVALSLRIKKAETEADNFSI
jgi:hypothetical protein